MGKFKIFKLLGMLFVSLCLSLSGGIRCFVYASAKKLMIDYKKNMPLNECQTLKVINARKGVTYSFELVSGSGELDGSTYCSPAKLESCSETPIIKVTDSEGYQTFVEIGLYAPDTSKSLHVVIARECTREHTENPNFCIETDHYFRICCWEVLGYNCDGSINRHQFPNGPELNGLCCTSDVYPHDIHDCDYSCEWEKSFYAENYPAYYETLCCPKIEDDPPPPPPCERTDTGDARKDGDGPSNCDCSHMVGDPIIILDGSHKEVEQDVVFPGLGAPLKFARHYNSLHGKPSSVGNGWNHTYGVVLEIPNGKIGYDLKIKDINGYGRYFKQVAADRYEGMYAEKTVIEYDGNGYSWKRSSGSVYRFDLTGRLVWIEDTAGFR